MQLPKNINPLSPIEDKKTLIIPISTVNNYYPATPEGWKNLKTIVDIYGYNHLTTFLVTETTNIGYTITENELTFLKEKHLEHNYDRTYVSEQTDEDIDFLFSNDVTNIKDIKSHPTKMIHLLKSLLKVGAIDKYECNIFMNDNMKLFNGDIYDIYTACIKLSNKLSKLSMNINTNSPNLTEQLHELQDYLTQIYGSKIDSLQKVESFIQLKDSIIEYMQYIRTTKTQTFLKLFNKTKEEDNKLKQSLIASNI